MSLSEDWYQLAIKQFKINEISYEELSLSEEQILIGRGGFGHIYKTKCNTIGTVAVKEILITLEDNETDIKNFTNELKIHSRIEHGRIIKFYGISRNIDKGLYYLVLEYANEGNLREFLIKKRNFSFEWEERKRLAIQIAEGLRYLHEVLHIAHRDLHTKNILINDGNIKISDFGLSKNLNSAMSSNNKFFGMIPFIDPQKLSNGKKFTLDKRSDIYSLGMVLWEISSCRTPFCEEDLACLSLKICQGLKEEPVKGTPMDYIRIYANCWQFEPEYRPLIGQILSRLRSISLEPVFEGDDELSPRSPDSPHDTPRNFSSEYSNNVSSLNIPRNKDSGLSSAFTQYWDPTPSNSNIANFSSKYVPIFPIPPIPPLFEDFEDFGTFEPMNTQHPDLTLFGGEPTLFEDFGTFEPMNTPSEKPSAFTQYRDPTPFTPNPFSEFVPLPPLFEDFGTFEPMNTSSEEHINSLGVGIG